MKGVRTIATILFYITRIIAILYLIVTLYAAFSVIAEWSYTTRDNEAYFSVCYPFTTTPFLVGENHWAYKSFNFLIPIGFYGVFFLLLSNVFNVFKQVKLFTQDGVTQLRYFYLANIFVFPLILLLAVIFYGKIEEGLDSAGVIHFFLGVFTYFLYAIFKQGVNLQNEQDLYI